MKRKPIPNLFEDSSAAAETAPAPTIALVPPPAELPAPAIETLATVMPPPPMEFAEAIQVPEDAPVLTSAPPATRDVRAAAKAPRAPKASPVGTAAVAAKVPLKKVTFWITEAQHDLLHRKTAERMMTGERVQISDVLRDALDAQFAKQN